MAKKKEEIDKYIGALVGIGGAFADKNMNRPIISTTECVYAHRMRMRFHVLSWIMLYIYRGVCAHVCFSYIWRYLPGISFTVVLPGYNIFKKLSSCHPGRQRERAERRKRKGVERREKKGRKKETVRDSEARERSC